MTTGMSLSADDPFKSECYGQRGARREDAGSWRGYLDPLEEIVAGHLRHAVVRQYQIHLGSLI